MRTSVRREESHYRTARDFLLWGEVACEGGVMILRRDRELVPAGEAHLLSAGRKLELLLCAARAGGDIARAKHLNTHTAGCPVDFPPGGVWIHGQDLGFQARRRCLHAHADD